VLIKAMSQKIIFRAGTDEVLLAPSHTTPASEKQLAAHEWTHSYNANQQMLDIAHLQIQVLRRKHHAYPLYNRACQFTDRDTLAYCRVCNLAIHGIRAK